MTVEQLCTAVEGKVISGKENIQRCIGSAMTCDLLSWVMARGEADMAWVTVQTNINVVAVAALHDLACVVLSEGNIPDQAVIDKAEEENIVLITTQLSSYAVCGALHAGNVK